MEVETARQEITQYFDFIDNWDSGKCKTVKKTGVGLFYPSELEFILKGFDSLKEIGVLKPGTKFCDAGSGDGRILALTSGLYEMPAFGIEYDPEIYKFSQINLLRLKEKGALNGTPFAVARGDFTDDSSYQSLGVNFQDIDVFFNFINNYLQITQKIAKESKKGTTFILYDGRHTPRVFPGLNLDLSLEIIEGCEKINPRYPNEDFSRAEGIHPSFIRYMHVYKK